MDIHLFISYVRLITGRAPTLIAPSGLHLMPDSSTSTGFSLHCSVGIDASGSDILEPIHQIGLELNQHELRGLSSSLLHEIALRSFNDLRTILLVHDKRMLGLVLQELDTLVSRRLLTPKDAEILRRGVAPTIIPGSGELKALIRSTQENPAIKNDMVLKPIRSVQGAEILFGSGMTQKAWMEKLLFLDRGELVTSSFVVQRKIQQPRYEIVLNGDEPPSHRYLVGTYLSIHGRYLGPGIWRTSGEGYGRAWICSVTERIDPNLTEKKGSKYRTLGKSLRNKWSVWVGGR